ncbi:MAG: tripartite tricarboxylate transporter substrate binding protein [Geminicoccaceae bacterium]|nr:tripartite tricarboxylate transporter substrate binding protein [Geminicoccaceae bacterium]
MRRRHACYGIFLSTLLWGMAEAAYPERPITVIVPWDAGGGTDISARIFAAGLEKELEVPVNVVNRSGGSGVVGHAAIANATPDGYTLGVGSPELAFLRTVGLADIGPESFTIISRITIIPAGVTVRADAPWKTLSELLEDVRRRPAGTFSASGSGQGGSWHMAIAGLLASQGMETDRIKWIPSRGGAPALKDLVAGGITMFTGSPIEGKALIESGQLRALAVMAPQRSPVFPEVPTLKETVGSDWTYENWFAFIGPRGLPPEIVRRLAEAGAEAHASAEVQEALKARGVQPIWDGPEAATAFARSFADKAADVLERLGLAKR